MKRAPNILWLDEPEEHDYPAALSYLTLLYDPEKATALVTLLRKARLVTYKAKDIIRASGLYPIGAVNFHVKHNLKKIAEKKALSPVLLIRGERLIIADGWHRVNAIYLLNEDADIPCHIV